MQIANWLFASGECFYLLKVTFLVGLTALFGLNHLHDLVCSKSVESRNGEPVGPTRGRRRRR